MKSRNSLGRDRPDPAVGRGAQARRAGAAVEAGHLAEDVAGPHDPEDDGLAGRGRLEDLERPLHQQDDACRPWRPPARALPRRAPPPPVRAAGAPGRVRSRRLLPPSTLVAASISPWGRAGRGRYTGPDDRREPPGQGLRGPGAADEPRCGQPPRPRRAPLRAPARHADADPPDPRLRRDAGGGRHRLRADRLGRGPRQDPGGGAAPARDGRRAPRQAPPGTRRSSLEDPRPPRPPRPSPRAGADGAARRTRSRRPPSESPPRRARRR